MELPRLKTCLLNSNVQGCGVCVYVRGGVFFESLGGVFFESLGVHFLRTRAGGGGKAHLRETVSRFSEIRFGSSISLRFPPPPRGCNRGTRAVGTESPGRRRGRRKPDRRPDGKHGPAAAAVVRGAEKPGRPGRRRPLPSPGARAGVPAAHLLSPSWPGKVLVGEVPPSRPLMGK